MLFENLEHLTCHGDHPLMAHLSLERVPYHKISVCGKKKCITTYCLFFPRDVACSLVLTCIFENDNSFGMPMMQYHARGVTDVSNN